MQNLVYNLPILYLAYRVFGRLYAADTIFGTVALSVFLDATHFLVDWSICNDPMLNSIFGGVLAGVGFGMVFRANANTGGLDVIAAVAKKYYSCLLYTSSRRSSSRPSGASSATADDSCVSAVCQEIFGMKKDIGSF